MCANPDASAAWALPATIFFVARDRHRLHGRRDQPERYSKVMEPVVQITVHIAPFRENLNDGSYSVASVRS